MLSSLKSLLIIIFLTLSFSYASPFNHPDKWKDPKILQLLKTSKILHIKSMKEFLTDKGKKIEFDGRVFLVTLDNNIQAVFKSLSVDDIGDAYAEVAAYQASLYLGFPYIPPTVIRKVNNMIGSLQLYIDTEIDLLADGKYQKALKEVPEDDQNKLKIFYFIFGQWDSGPHNLLLFKDTKKSYFIAIDNSAIRNHQHLKFGELPFVRTIYSEKLNTNDWHKPFPFGRAEIIEPPYAENFKQRFKDKLPNSFYKNFKSYIKKPIKFVVYQNSLWRQHHAFDENFVRSIPSSCDKQTIEIIKKLDLLSLKKIFVSANGSDFLTKSYLNSILNRRDQLLGYCLVK